MGIVKLSKHLSEVEEIHLKYLQPKHAACSLITGWMTSLHKIWAADDVTFWPSTSSTPSTSSPKLCPVLEISSWWVLGFQVYAPVGLPIYSLSFSLPSALHWFRTQSTSLSVHIKPLMQCNVCVADFTEVLAYWGEDVSKTT